MTSRELVKKGIERRCPERIPLCSMWEAWKPGGKLADIERLGFSPAQDFVPSKPGMNEWGCVYESLTPGLGGQVVEHPLSDWGAIKNYRFPDPFAPGRLQNAALALKKLRKQGLYVFGSIDSGPMHLLDYLRGFENYLADLLLYPERIELLLDGIFNFLAGMARQYGDLGVDGILLYDDQAMQSGPLFSMDIWRQRFKPRYRKLFDMVHSSGMHVYMHACGDLSQHLVELVEAGVDIIDNKQPSLWMNSLAVDEVRGKVTFSTCVDIQSTVHTLAENQIENEVSRLIRRLSVPEGCFIGTCYPNPALRIPPEKMERMLRAFQTFCWD